MISYVGNTQGDTMTQATTPKDEGQVGEWITTERAAEILGVSVRRARQIIDEEHLAVKRVNPRLMLVRQYDIENIKAKRA